MGIDEIIRARRTVHSYAAKPVPREILDRALEGAHHAPNHRLTFPWRFLLIGPKAREKLVALSLAMAEKKGPLSDMKRESIRTKLANPGILMAVACVKSADPVRAREDYGAVACALENLMLSLCSAGYGSKWTTGSITRDPQTYDILSVDSNSEEIVGFVLAGVPASTPEPAQRPPYQDFVREIP